MNRNLEIGQGESWGSRSGNLGLLLSLYFRRNERVVANSEVMQEIASFFCAAYAIPGDFPRESTRLRCFGGMIKKAVVTAWGVSQVTKASFSKRVSPDKPIDGRDRFSQILATQSRRVSKIQRFIKAHLCRQNYVGFCRSFAEGLAARHSLHISAEPGVSTY